MELNTITRTSSQSHTYCHSQLEKTSKMIFNVKTLFATALAFQSYIVLAKIEAHTLLRAHDLAETLNQKLAIKNCNQSITSKFILTGSLAEQLRAKLSFVVGQDKANEHGLDVPGRQRTQQKYNEKYAQRIIRLSKYFLEHKFYLDKSIEFSSVFSLSNGLHFTCVSLLFFIFIL